MNEQSSGFKLECPIFEMGPSCARNVNMRFAAHDTRIGEGNICLKRAESSEEGEAAETDEVTQPRIATGSSSTVVPAKGFPLTKLHRSTL
jgi:hypothetical protein